MKISGRRAYTLIELVAVAALLTALFSLSVAAYYAWTRQSALEAAAQTVLSALGRARAQALALRTETRFVALPEAQARADAWTLERRAGGTGSWWSVTGTNRLPEAIRFNPLAAIKVHFRADGCPAVEADDEDAEEPIRFALYLRRGASETPQANDVRVVEVQRLTGFAREAPP